MICGEDGPHESYEIWLAPKDAYKTWEALIAAGATPVGSEALEMQRIADGIPLYGIDIHERATCGAEADVRDVMRWNWIAAERIDLEAGVVRMSDRDLERLAVRGVAEPNVAERATAAWFARCAA